MKLIYNTPSARSRLIDTNILLQKTFNSSSSAPVKHRAKPMRPSPIDTDLANSPYKSEHSFLKTIVPVIPDLVSQKPVKPKQGLLTSKYADPVPTPAVRAEAGPLREVTGYLNRPVAAQHVAASEETRARYEQALSSTEARMLTFDQ